MKKMKKNENGFVKNMIAFFKRKPLYFLALLALIGSSVGMLAVSAASGGDCSDNSIVKCGAFSGGSASMDTLKGRMTSSHYSIYKKAIGRDVPAGELNEGSFKRGFISDDNKVYMYNDQSKWWDDNHKLVGTNAYSFGRKPYGKSDELTAGDGTVFYKRNPSQSFGTGGLNSWLKFDALGRFEYAIIRVCGNPVIADPVGGIIFEKYVGGVTTQSDKGYLEADKGRTDNPKLTVKSGETISYKIGLRNTSTRDISITNIADHVEELIGNAVDINTFKLTKNVTVPGVKEVVGGKKGIDTNKFVIVAGGSMYIEFTVKVKDSFSGDFNNLACISLTDYGGFFCDSAQVIVDPPTPDPTPTPTVKCDSLTATKIGTTKNYTIKIAGSVSGGVTIAEYIINVNGQKVSKSALATEYILNGSAGQTYEIVGQVKSSDGKISPSAAACRVTVTIPADPTPTPTVKCDSLTATKIGTTKNYIIKIAGSVSGGVTIAEYIINVNGQKVSKSALATEYTLNGSAGQTYEIVGQVKSSDGKISPSAAACRVTVTIPADPVPSYQIIKKVNGQDANTNSAAVDVDANEEFEYSVQVVNTGEVDLTNVKVWDILPAGVVYKDGTLKLDGVAVGSDSDVSNDNDFFNAGVGVIVPKIAKRPGSVTFTFKASIVAAEDKVDDMCAANGTHYKNVAKADPEGTGTGLGEKEDPAVVKCDYIPPVERPSVEITKDVSKYDVAVGEVFDWILKVKNNGNIDLNNVRVSDSAPANTEFVSAADVSGVNITLDPRTLSATIAKLKVGEEVRIVIKAKVTAYQEGEITNEACVDAPEVNPGDLSGKDDCDNAEVKPKPQMCVVPGKETLTAGSADCYEPCKIPGLEGLKNTDPNCDKGGTYTPPTSVTPSTGAALPIVAAIAVVIGCLVYVQTVKKSSAKQKNKK
jgi:uncharacterized repeat protein (TIGR01451 family)